VRILILSDVHGNLAALEAVLQDVERGGGFQAAWNLGDAVGYGPQPSECIARLRDAGAVSVAGNHDLAAAKEIGAEEFNRDAAAAVRWTHGQLSGDERETLARLPRMSEQGEFTLVHGTLRDPVWEYLFSYESAREHLALQRSPYSLVGHTHVPALVVEDETLPRGCELYRIGDGHGIRLGAGKLVINAGSVGQPRDGDPRASYAVYDTDERRVTLHRVEYDIGATQRLMEGAGLPRRLAERLAEGT
jgi:diadenosine tetraphosphatase ApaH/serine/threonine PP2A family protein phosphatase